MSQKSIRILMAAVLLAFFIAFNSPVPAAPSTRLVAPAATLAMEVGTTAS